MTCLWYVQRSRALSLHMEAQEIMVRRIILLWTLDWLHAIATRSKHHRDYEL